MKAFFCRTPIHVFRSIQLTMQVFPQDNCDIYVFDTFPQSDGVAGRLNNLRIFANVFYIYDKEFMRYGVADSLRTTCLSSEFKKILLSNNYEDVFVFNVYGAFNELIFNVLKKKNRTLKFNIVEDGPSIYHIQKYKAGVTKKFLYPLFGVHSYLDNVKKWWFSIPELMDPLNNGEKEKLPKVNRADTEFVSVINNVFKYDNNHLIRTAKIIFMEECYWSDGLLPNGEDLKLIKEIQSQIGEQIVVKLHPRTKEDRFSEEFNVVPANGIPWEVYALNMNMDEKVLISLSCSTMVSTKLLYGDETYSLILYPIVEDKIRDKKNGEKYLSDERKAKIDSQSNVYAKKDKFAKADTVSDAIDILDRWLMRI